MIDKLVIDLSRFTKIHVLQMEEADCCFISTTMVSDVSLKPNSF
jgi:hypothetical protein